MQIGVYSGSFDPITKGHIDIIERAAKLSEKLIVTVLNNINKNYMFTLEEREVMVRECVKNIPNVEVVTFQGLLVDFMKDKGITLIYRGIRAVSDYEYELAMAFANDEISGGKVETIFIPAKKKYMYLSSTIVREIAMNGGNLSLYLPKNIEKKVEKKVKSKL